MRHAYLSLAFALSLTAAHAQTPAWTGGAQTTNPAPTNDTGANGRAVSADAAGNVYVGGTLVNGGGSGALAVRNFGNNTLTSQGNGFGSGFIAKLSAAQQWQWATRVTNNGEGTNIRLAAATPAGEVYAAGDISEITGGTALTVGPLTQTIAASEAFFIVRLNTNGQPLALATGQLANATSTSFVRLVSLAWDAASGTLVATGYYKNAALQLGSTVLPATTTGAMFVARLSTTGQWQNVTSVSATGTSNTEFGIVDASVGTQGQAGLVVYLAGGSITLGTTNLTSSSTTAPKIAVAQLSAAGQWQWVAQLPNATENAALYDVGYAPDGSAWVLGSGPAGLQVGSTTLPANTEGFVARLSAAGQWGTVGLIGRQNSSYIGETRKLTVDGAGNAVVAGVILNGETYSFGSQLLSAGASRRDYVARFNTAGQWQYALVAPLSASSSNSNYNFNSVALDGTGNLLAVGSLRGGSVTFEPTVLTGSTGGDVLVGKLANAGLPLAVRQAAGVAPLAVYPNPATTGASATLRLPTAATAAQPLVLRDALGRVARQVSIPAGRREVAVSTAGLAPGLYLLEAGLSRTQLVVE